MREELNKFREYLDYIERHYDNVQTAWNLIQTKCKGKGFRFLTDDFCWHQINYDIVNHDYSKLSKEEFTAYRRKFFPTNTEKMLESSDSKGDLKEQVEKDFLKAWHHHKNNNLHHWQSWTAQKPTPYDDCFVVMMMVDWVAMGFEFGDTAKSYYEKNKDQIKLPEWSVKLMYEIFDCIYP